MLGQVALSVQQKNRLREQSHDLGCATLVPELARYIVGPAQRDTLDLPGVGINCVAAQSVDPLPLPVPRDGRITIQTAIQTMRPPRDRPGPGSSAVHKPPAGAVEYYPTACCAILVASVDPVVPRARSIEAKGVVDQVVDTVELRRRRPPNVESRMLRLQWCGSVQPLLKAVNRRATEGRSRWNPRFCFALNHRSLVSTTSTGISFFDLATTEFLLPYPTLGLEPATASGEDQSASFFFLAGCGKSSISREFIHGW